MTNDVHQHSPAFVRAIHRVAEVNDYFQGQAEDVVEGKEEDVG